MKALACASKVNKALAGMDSDQRIVFESLDDVRLALVDANLEIEQKFSARLKHAGTVSEDGTVTISKKETENVIRKEFDIELPAHILQATKSQTLGAICTHFGYEYNATFSNTSLKSADSSSKSDISPTELAFSKIGDPSAPLIKSPIFLNEFYNKAENSPQPYELRCLRQIACIAWARADWKERAESLLKTDVSSVQEIPFSEYEERIHCSSALWMMKILMENKYEEFMAAVGYERSVLREPGREHFEIRSNAYNDCEWIFGNFNHKAPINISSDIYRKSVTMTQFVVLMNAWRRLVPTKNALQGVLTKVGYKPIK